MPYGDIRDELGLIDGCICDPAIPGNYSGTLVPDCPHHEDLRKAMINQAFERVLEQHSEALDQLAEM